MISADVSWNNERGRVLRASMAFDGGHDTTDNICGNCLSGTSSVWCSQCYKDICASCDRDMLHQNPLHDRSSYINGYKAPLSPLEVLTDLHNIQPSGILQSVLSRILEK